MKLRTKTIITISLISLMIFGVLQGITALIIEPSFDSIEKKESEQNIQQALSTITYSLSLLEGQLKDYAFWDDTYNFVQDKNQEYLENNFVESTFENLNIDFLGIVDNDRNVVYCQSFNSNNSTKVATSEETKRILTSDNDIWEFNSTEESISGIILIDNRPMLVATAPVLTSLNQGPSLGGMIFGRSIDEKEIDQLREIMDLNFSINSISDLKLQQNDSEIVDSLLQAGQSIVVKDNSPSTVSAYALIRDIYSNPTLVLKITQDRTADQQALWVKNIFLASSLALSVCVGLGFLFLLEREIIKPMMKLAANVEEITLQPTNIKTAGKIKSSHELNVLSNAVRDSVNKRLEGMNEVSRMVGHDLRNPLAGIRGATYVLKKNYSEKLDAKGNAMLKTIDDCVEYSDKIVRDLLDFSTEIKLDKIITTTSKLVKDSLSTLVVPANIQVIDQTSDELLVFVDNGKIERVFSNLIKNACDAMPEGGVLKITNKIEKNQAKVSFSDNGSGMTKEVMTKLWTPFFTTKPKGMGIGLGICKRIAESHGGRIEVETSLGKGSVFTVFLPLKNNQI